MAKVKFLKKDKNISSSTVLTLKHSNYVEKYTNLRKYLISSLILNGILLSSLIYLTTIR